MSAREWSCQPGDTKVEERIPKCGRGDTKVWKRGYQSVDANDASVVKKPKSDASLCKSEKAMPPGDTAKKRCRLREKAKKESEACVQKPKSDASRGIPKCGREDTKVKEIGYQSVEEGIPKCGVWKTGYQSVEEGIPKCDQRCKPREKAKKDASLRAKVKKQCRLREKAKKDATVKSQEEVVEKKNRVCRKGSHRR